MSLIGLLVTWYTNIPCSKSDGFNPNGYIKVKEKLKFMHKTCFMLIQTSLITCISVSESDVK